ncbi:MAG TPA: histidine phosphatase family protein [Xanthomonadales bacterium]|nr:histidine phosphatase family protein [Xanthomonadales bacterium]
MKIYLVRHGEASASWQEADNPGLSERGRQQAAATAEQLFELVDPAIQLVSSPMLRARQTAQPLSRNLGAEVAIVEAFREIPTPVPLPERQAWLKSVARQSWSEQHQMVRGWHQSLLQELRQIKQPTVVFTHFMVLNAIVGALSEKDRVICFLPDNASVTTLQWSDETLQVVELGRQLKTIVH